MKPRVFTSILVIMLLIVAVIPPLMSTGCTSGGDTLKIGVMTPSTGIAAEKGSAGKAGALDCIRYINEELGGVNGYEIEAVYRDSNYDTDKVAPIVNEFMDEGCLMFMTHSSKEMSAAQTIANDEGFPGLVCYASPTNYNPPEHIYAQTPDYGNDFTTFAQYYMDTIWGDNEGEPKVVIFGLDNTTGSGARDGATAIADQLGLDFNAASDYYEHSADTLDETADVLLVKGKNPDLIFISSTPAPSAVIMNNLYEQEVYPNDGVTVAMAHASFTEQLIELAGNDAALEDVYGVFPTATWSDDIPAVDKAREYAEEYSPDYVGNADYLSTWTTMIIIREILETAMDNGVTYETLAKGDADAWEAIEEQGIQELDGYDVEGLQGAVSYTEGYNGLAKQLRIFQITDGEMIPFEGWFDVPSID